MIERYAAYIKEWRFADKAINSKKAGDDPTSMQSPWQGSVAAVGACGAPAKALGGVVIGA
jgi:hypothetical protein